MTRTRWQIAALVLSIACAGYGVVASSGAAAHDGIARKDDAADSTRKTDNETRKDANDDTRKATDDDAGIHRGL